MLSFSTVTELEHLDVVVNSKTIRWLVFRNAQISELRNPNVYCYRESDVMKVQLLNSPGLCTTEKELVNMEQRRHFVAQHSWQQQQSGLFLHEQQRTSAEQTVVVFFCPITPRSRPHYELWCADETSFLRCCVNLAWTGLCHNWARTKVISAFIRQHVPTLSRPGRYAWLSFYGPPSSVRLLITRWSWSLSLRSSYLSKQTFSLLQKVMPGLDFVLANDMWKKVLKSTVLAKFTYIRKREKSF